MRGRHRDRLVALGAALATAAMLTGIVALVLTAQRDGRRALERLQISEVEQVAGAFDVRVAATLELIAGVVASPPWNVEPGDRDDQSRLDTLQGLLPGSTTGFLLVDVAGTLTAGTLLRDPSAVGRPVERAGLADALATATPTFLPVSVGLTTDRTAFAAFVPVHDAAGVVNGFVLLEADVHPSSDLNTEVSRLGHGATGAYIFVDEHGTVVAAADPDRLARPTEEPLPEPGLWRDGGMVVAVAEMPDTRWRVVFRQDAAEFDGPLTRPLRRAVGLLVAAGLIIGMVAFLVVIRRLAAAREEQRRLAEVSQAREEFISIVSHELRTPMTAVMGFLELTDTNWDTMSEPERRDAVARASANAQRLHALTTDVLDTATLEAGQLSYTFVTVDLRAEVSRAVETISVTLNTHDISWGPSGPPLPVRADPARLHQAIANLIDNAVKNAPLATTIAITVAAEGGSASFTVADRGPGLSDSELNRVFDKFVRGRNSASRGSGLGLYICRRILEAHGGSIRADNVAAGGAAFTVTLPIANGAIAPPPPQPQLRV